MLEFTAWERTPLGTWVEHYFVKYPAEWPGYRGFKPGWMLKGIRWHFPDGTATRWR